MSDNNIRNFPFEKVDRVVRLATALTNVLALSDNDAPEDHLAALLLVQTALQQTVARERGLGELQRVLLAAAERRRKYDVAWVYPLKGG